MKIENYYDLVEAKDYSVVHIGFSENEMRMVFQKNGSPRTGFVIIMRGVVRYFDKGVVGHGPVILSLTSGPGSFGWDLPDSQRQCKELHISSKKDRLDNLFRIIAKDIAFRASSESDLNYPG